MCFDVQEESGKGLFSKAPQCECVLDNRLHFLGGLVLVLVLDIPVFVHGDVVPNVVGMVILIRVYIVVVTVVIVIILVRVAVVGIVLRERL